VAALCHTLVSERWQALQASPSVFKIKTNSRYFGTFAPSRGQCVLYVDQIKIWPVEYTTGPFSHASFNLDLRKDGYRSHCIFNLVIMAVFGGFSPSRGQCIPISCKIWHGKACHTFIVYGGVPYVTQSVKGRVWLSCRVFQQLCEAYNFKFIYLFNCNVTVSVMSPLLHSLHRTDHAIVCRNVWSLLN